LQAVKGRIEALGPDHPRTLTSMHNLGQVYLKQGRVSEAAEQEVQITNTMKRIYGPLDVNTVANMVILASIYLKGGLLKEAESVQVELVDLMTEERGEDHSVTLWFMRDLAENYALQGRDSEHKTLIAKITELEGSVEQF
ncbi:hypothetical protein FRC09_014287, partial [Ceratobasidium sp. 395]